MSRVERARLKQDTKKFFYLPRQHVNFVKPLSSFFSFSADPLSNMCLKFSSKEAAVNYAEKQGKYIIFSWNLIFGFGMCFLTLLKQNFLSEDFFHVTGNPSLLFSFSVEKKVVASFKNMYTTFVTW